MPVLLARQLLMTMSNEPFEGGYRMVLADLFRHDPAAYGRAKAKVDFSII